MKATLTDTSQGTDKAQHQMDKAIQNEHKTAAAVEKATHNHQAAVQSEASLEKSLNVNTCTPTHRAIANDSTLHSSRDSTSSASSRSFRRDAELLTNGNIART